MFRTRCRECCFGRGRMHQHRAGGRETGILAIAIDYVYLHERDDQLQETAGAPIVVSKCVSLDRRSHSTGIHSDTVESGRCVFVTIDGKVYKLLKAMYGLRDAGASLDRKVLDVMNLMGVSLSKLRICVGYRKAMEMGGQKSLCSALVKTTAVLGPNSEIGDVQEAIHLNRLL